MENKEYFRKCPNCNNLVKCKNRRMFLQNTCLNKPCKSCTTKKVFAEKFEKEWMPVIGYRPSTKVFHRIKKHWNSLSVNQKNNILQKNDKNKRIYFDHLPRTNRRIAKRNVKLAFEKYKGQNHWTKRPEILQKIKNSCKKYCGENHWFNKYPEIKKKMLDTKMRKYGCIFVNVKK
jgi:hypothetical protein